MLFGENFLENVEEEPIVSIVKAIDICFDTISEDPFKSWTQQEYENLFETYSLILVILDSFDLGFIEKEIDFTGEIIKDCQSLQQYLQNTNSQFRAKSSLIKLESMKNKFKKEFNQSFAYEFSQGDLDRIQVLINELREEIKKSNLFEAKHQQRLLKRLEKLQAEMHKKMSDVDRFWGLIGDAGVVLGKFGKDSKPFVDRMKEISDIVWRTQSRAEELPSNTPSPTLIEAEIIEE